MPREQVLAGIRAALTAGALTADVVALEARKAADTTIRTPKAKRAPVRDAARCDRRCRRPTAAACRLR